LLKAIIYDVADRLPGERRIVTRPGLTTNQPQEMTKGIAFVNPSDLRTATVIQDSQPEMVLKFLQTAAIIQALLPVEQIGVSDQSQIAEAKTGRKPYSENRKLDD
jgi:hypothetical protein